LALSALVAAGSARALAAAEEGRTHVIVVLATGPSASTPSPGQAMERIRWAQDRVLAGAGRGEFRLVYRYRNFAAMTGWATGAALERLASHPEVAAIGPEAKGRLNLDTSRPYLGADQVEARLGITGAGATVAVIDSGIDSDHPDLAGDIAPGAFHFLDQGGDVGFGAEDDTATGHGTQVAGVITGEGIVAPRGIAPGALVLPLKACDADGECLASDWAAAVDLLITQRRRHPRLVAVNLSLGHYLEDVALPEPCPCDQTIAATQLGQAALAAARAAGILPIAASGNRGSCGERGAMGFPACLSAALAVGAVHDVDLGREPDEGSYRDRCLAGPRPHDCSDTADCFDAAAAPGTVACWADRTDCLGLLAPGQGIRTAAKGGGVSESSGSSLAAPHAAAVAALLAGRCLGAGEVERILRDSGSPVVEPCAGGPAGRRAVDALAAVSLAAAKSPPCADCNRNLIPDAEDLAGGVSEDCDRDGIPDECQEDCDRNGVPDACDLRAGTAADCNANCIPDACDVRPRDFTFLAPAAHGVGLAPAFLRCVDLDGDGAPDLVAAASLSPRLALLTNDGAGRFPRLEPLVAGDLPSGIAAGDLDGDGAVDLAVGQAFAGTIAVFSRRDGVPWIQAATADAGGRPGALAAGDLDGDGDLDLASALEAGDEVVVFLGAGAGAFLPGRRHAVGELPIALEEADVDGDGRRDLLTANAVSGDLSVLAGTGGGEFAPALGVPLGLHPHQVALADFDRDGQVDLAASDGSSGTIAVYLRHADGDFAPPRAHDAWPGPLAAAVTALLTADFDGDGGTDVGAASTSPAIVSVLGNAGEGRLEEALYFAAGSRPLAAVAADLTGDGLSDVAVASGDSPIISILVNGSARPRSGDLAGDGIPDECQAVRFRRGDSNGDGEADVSDAIALLGHLFLGQPGPGCADAADANDDEDLDISDAIALLGFLFLGAPAPPAPGPEGPCGPDPARGRGERLGCEGYAGC
jgi:hypothetical protein